MTLTDIVLAAVVYPVILTVLALAVQPMRVRMVKLAEGLLADRRITDSQRARLNHMLDSAVAFRVGLLLPVAVVSVALDEALGRSRPRPAEDKWLEGDRRFHGIVLRYFASISAANPLGLLVALPFMTITIFVAVLRGMPLSKAAMEEPLLRASEGTSIPIPA